MALIDKETIRTELDEKDMEMYQEVMTAIIFAKNRLKELGCEGLSERMTTAFEWLKTKFKSICSQLKQEPNIRFPEEKNIIWKVFGAGNLESWEYDEAEALVKLAKEELIKDMQCQIDEALELVAEYNLKPYRDGNAWCVLLGRDIQSGICGFGNTLTETYLDFLKSYKEYKHPIGELLNSIQEQPASEGLEKEIADYIEGCLGGLEGQEIASCARHFYELGQQSRPKSSDTPQEDLDNSLEEEIENYFNGWCNGDEYGQAVMPDCCCAGVDDCKDIARHFAEWGAEHIKK